MSEKTIPEKKVREKIEHTVRELTLDDLTKNAGKKKEYANGYGQAIKDFEKHLKKRLNLEENKNEC